MAEKKYLDFVSRKEQHRKYRIIIQWLVLAVIIFTAINSLYTLKDYTPYQEDDNVRFVGNNGFVAVSYLGVSRLGDQKLISVERFAEQMRALKQQGYVTITQQDIADYYQLGKVLPEKALFIMFEDGRRDTSIFVQKILEELNYKATIFIDAEKFSLQDVHLLTLEEVETLKRTSYWDVGTNHDLMCLKPQAYWFTNHLLMRIKYDTNQTIEFVKGNSEKLIEWEIKTGAAEFRDQSIIVTSPPNKEGVISLKGSASYKDLNLNVVLSGNKFGVQKIYLRADNALDNYLAVSIDNNILKVDEKINGDIARNIIWLDLYKIDENINSEQLDEQINEQAKSVSSITISEKGKRHLSVSLKDDLITIGIDDKVVISDFKINLLQNGGVFLASAWGGYGWSQQKLADDIYDGVFTDLTITSFADKNAIILYESDLQGLDKLWYNTKTKWHLLVNWFIEYL